jgi:hypothetical protein
MGWQLSRGIDGNFAVESVAAFLRIRWQNSVEYAKSAGRLKLELKKYAKPALLILD